MANDPHEMRDLASEPQHSEMVADLSARLRTYRGK
jgi:hypothetical protein